MDKIGQRISTMRNSRGLNQIDLARMVGVSRSTIGMWETGNRRPGYTELEALADAFNVPIGALLGDEKQRQEEEELVMLREAIRSNSNIKDILKISAMLSPHAIMQLKAIAQALLDTEACINAKFDTSPVALPKNVSPVSHASCHMIPNIGTLNCTGSIETKHAAKQEVAEMAAELSSVTDDNVL